MGVPDWWGGGGGNAGEEEEGRWEIEGQGLKVVLFSSGRRGGYRMFSGLVSGNKMKENIDPTA